MQSRCLQLMHHQCQEMLVSCPTRWSLYWPLYQQRDGVHQCTSARRCRKSASHSDAPSLLFFYSYPQLSLAFKKFCLNGEREFQFWACSCILWFNSSLDAFSLNGNCFTLTHSLITEIFYCQQHCFWFKVQLKVQLRHLTVWKNHSRFSAGPSFASPIIISHAKWTLKLLVGS